VSEHVSDLRWDRWLAGELASEDAAAAVAHAETCERCGARMRELTAARDAFRDRPFPLALKRRRRGVWIGAAATLAAAAAAVVLVVRPGDPEGGERTKGGGPALTLIAGPRGEHWQRQLSSGDVIYTGEPLQAYYTSASDGFGAVLAIDGANGVYAYVPSRGDLMAALPAGEGLAFPESTILDDVTGRERVFLLWCERPHALAPVLAELRATGDLAKASDCQLRRIELQKVKR
jgi:hypothetical protein